MTKVFSTGTAILVSRRDECVYRDPAEIVTAHRLQDVVPSLRHIEQSVQHGRHAVGFLAYEAGPAFDDALVAHPPCSGLPLLWFGLYEGPTQAAESREEQPAYKVGSWTPLVSQVEYETSLARIRDLIAAGDTYQVNFTFPLVASFQGDDLAWFRNLCRAQRSDYCAYVDIGSHAILSVSPELFFELDGNTLTTRPMKGTRPRGRWLEEDRLRQQELLQSDKDQAENVMIVDLLRNDMGRVSEVGSVRVETLFDVERYETVWQMTSTIVSKTTAPVPDIFAALFPCGSVTGAPKARTTAIIHEQERAPRGVYCGAIGYWRPGRRAKFSVAIRTVTVDRSTDMARYSVGSGITWDSRPGDEYEECHQKASILHVDRQGFALLESILLSDSYFLLEEHMARLQASAAYFEFPLDADRLKEELESLRMSREWSGASCKVRVLLFRDGSRQVEISPAPATRPVRLTLARTHVNEQDRFLFHKTTNRRVYEDAKAACPSFDDVILYNSRGEITESTTANLVAMIGGVWLTPPIECGLLAGTFRGDLLAKGEIQEGILRKSDLRKAERLCLINSVRRWIPVESVDWGI